MTITEAQTVLRSETELFLDQTTDIVVDGSIFPVQNRRLGIRFDIDATLRHAWIPGHSNDAMLRRLQSLWTTHAADLAIVIDENQLMETLTSSVPILKQNQPQDARFIKVNGRDSIVPEKGGLTFNSNPVRVQIAQYFASMNRGVVHLEIIPQAPQISVDDIRGAIGRYEALQRAYVRLYFGYDGYSVDEWSFHARDYRDWMEFRKVKSDSGFTVTPVFNTSKMYAYLGRRIAPYLYRPQENVTIENDNGSPRIVGTARDGQILDIAATVRAINDSVTCGRARWNVLSVPLVVKILPAVVTNPENPFGLSDILAVGMTDFFGSPKNRVFNISHAAPRFHNVVVKQGEEFSFVKFMGPVDSLNGYRKELVIVNADSTEPQWGGGICQVSSTLYRAALFAGLDITARSSHSFEVKYYQPAGLDATVFDPAPDFKFRNNTSGSILIQNYVDEKRTKMIVTLIGKKDGRSVNCEGPVELTGGGVGADKYAFAWVRTITFGGDSVSVERFLSVYTRKDLVKKYRPEEEPPAPAVVALAE